MLDCDRFLSQPMKIIVLSLSITLVSDIAIGQIATNATQTLNLVFSSAIDINFNTNSSAIGLGTSVPLGTINNYANDADSAEQILKVQSNKSFIVTAKTNNISYTYNKATIAQHVNPYTGILSIIVSANNIGSAITTPFSPAVYKTLSYTNQNIIKDAIKCGSQTYNIKYKISPEYICTDVAHTVNVLYTATQQ